MKKERTENYTVEKKEKAEKEIREKRGKKNTNEAERKRSEWMKETTNERRSQKRQK